MIFTTKTNRRSVKHQTLAVLSSYYKQSPDNLQHRQLPGADINIKQTRYLLYHTLQQQAIDEVGFQYIARGAYLSRRRANCLHVPSNTREKTNTQHHQTNRNKTKQSDKHRARHPFPYRPTTTQHTRHAHRRRPHRKKKQYKTQGREKAKGA